MTRDEIIKHEQKRIEIETNRLIESMKKCIEILQTSLNEEKEIPYKLARSAQNVAERLSQNVSHIEKEYSDLELVKSVFDVLED